MYENPEVLFGGQKRFEDLVALIYEAVGESSLWSEVAEAVAESLNAGSTWIYANYGRAQAEDIMACVRSEPNFMNQYVQYYQTVNVWIEPSNRIFPDGTPRYGHVAVPEHVLESSEFYNDYLRPAGLFHSLGLRIPLRGLHPLHMTILRPKENGAYGPKEGTMLTALLPYLQRALRCHIQFSMLRSGLAATLDHLPYGLVLLDASGKCVLLNKLAQKIVDNRDGLLLVDGRLFAACSSESSRLREIITRTVGRTALTQGGGALLISRRTGTFLQIVVSPFATGLVGAPPQVVATVYIRDPEAAASAPVPVIQSLYGLTRAEAKLAALLLEGHDMTEAAELKRVTRETVRSQLRSIFQKTGTRRQAELVRLLAAIPPVRLTEQ